MNSRYHAVIMAGGIGSRFWPLSRNEKPKQFLDILGTGQSLLQMTYHRLEKFIDKEKIWIVAHRDYSHLIREQLPQLNINRLLSEPARKNTAACLLLTATLISQEDPDALLFIAPSDHLIIDETTFVDNILAAFSFIELQEQYLLTFGIQASRPDTGYGYIRFESDQNLAEDIYKVKEFVEKPDHNTAVHYLQSGNYVWNSGMFLWSCKSFLLEMSKSAPDMWQLFQDFSLAQIESVYIQCESTSIDYALMEKTDKAVVLKVDFGWNDLGTWGSLYQIKTQDENQNSIQGALILAEETSNCLIENTGNQLIAIQGLEDFIVVNTADVLLICQKSSEQKIKELVEKARSIQSGKFT